MDLCATLADQSAMLLVCRRQVLNERQQPRFVKCQSTDQTKEPECRKGVRECTLQSFHICHFFLAACLCLRFLNVSCASVLDRDFCDSIPVGSRIDSQFKGNNVQVFVTRWDEVPRMTQGSEEYIGKQLQKQLHNSQEVKLIMEHCP